MINQDELNEAISLAKKMKNAFKAFEDIEKLLQVQAAMQGVASDLELKATALRVELAALAEKLGVEQADFGDKINKLDDDIAKARIEYDAEVKRIDDLKAAARMELNAEISKMASDRAEATKKNDGAISSMRQDLMAATTAHEKAMAEFAKEEDSKRTVLASLQAEIDALKQKFA